jgi:hypothetical protein
MKIQQCTHVIDLGKETPKKASDRKTTLAILQLEFILKLREHLHQHVAVNQRQFKD